VLQCRPPPAPAVHSTGRGLLTAADMPPLNGHQHTNSWQEWTLHTDSWPATGSREGAPLTPPHLCILQLLPLLLQRLLSHVQLNLQARSGQGGTEGRKGQETGLRMGEQSVGGRGCDRECMRAWLQSGCDSSGAEKDNVGPQVTHLQGCQRSLGVHSAAPCGLQLPLARLAGSCLRPQLLSLGSRGRQLLLQGGRHAFLSLQHGVASSKGLQREREAKPGSTAAVRSGICSTQAHPKPGH
jgi:hypothetical protein